MRRNLQVSRTYYPDIKLPAQYSFHVTMHPGNGNGDVAERAQKGPALPICFCMTSSSSLAFPLLWFLFQTASHLAVNMLSSTAFLLYSLTSLVESSPLAAEHYHNQSTTLSQHYPNGTNNPFYHWGAATILLHTILRHDRHQHPAKHLRQMRDP
jgi:hypothetical protein